MLNYCLWAGVSSESVLYHSTLVDPWFVEGPSVGLGIWGGTTRKSDLVPGAFTENGNGWICLGLVLWVSLLDQTSALKWCF